MEDYSNFSMEAINKAIREMLAEVKRTTGASDQEISAAFNEAATRFMDTNGFREEQGEKMIKPLQITDETKEKCICTYANIVDEYCPKSDAWHREQVRLREERCLCNGVGCVNCCGPS